MLVPPDWIDQRAQEEFKILASQLQDVLRPTDIYVLADYCQALSDVIDLMAVVKTEGKTLRHPETGVTKMNPNVSLLMSRRQDLQRLRNDLGLTPRARREKLNRGGKQTLKDRVKTGDDLL